ncbi:MAG: hypothetical protein ACHRXM_06325 [Isosphaerales bacterium]
MPFGDEDEAGRVLAEPSAGPAPKNAASLPPRPVESNSLSPVFHPLAYRSVVADWPVEWREQWGRRANALEESGLSWRDAETQAFVEVWNLRRHQQTAHSPADALTPSNVERN